MAGKRPTRSWPLRVMAHDHLRHLHRNDLEPLANAKFNSPVILSKLITTACPSRIAATLILEPSDTIWMLSLRSFSKVWSTGPIV